MKKSFYVAGMMFFLACTDSSKVKDASAIENKTETSSASSAIFNHPDYEKGLQLVAKSDCMTCHKVNDLLVGPSYAAVANKYEATEANINLLATKIVKGGQGVWGEVPMAAHPTLSKEDAVQMVKYIMLFKDEKSKP